MQSSSDGVDWKTLKSLGGKRRCGAGFRALPLILGPSELGSGWESDHKLGHRLNISLTILYG